MENDALENDSLEYFVFEQDFVEKGIRCIPMIVRKKMDVIGIKLKLAHWSKFNKRERLVLSIQACTTVEQRHLYRAYLTWLIKKYTGEDPVLQEPDDHPAWQVTAAIPAELQEKAAEFGWTITIRQWAGITELQRFALLKLCRPGHENKNFPIAIKEFGLVEEVAPGRPEHSGS
jgi:hypothetical protein